MHNIIQKGTQWQEKRGYGIPEQPIIKEKHPFRIHSLCLMTNHFHIAVETQEIELWKIMQKILSIYAEEFNHKYNFTGHVFESRYTACLIEDERYFLEVSRYIHLNPVKAQMVREPGTYEYSSYDMFVHDKVTGGQKKITKMICDLVGSGDRVLLQKCYISQKGLFGEEVFRSAGGVAGGWPGPHFFESEIRISEMQI